ncbi:MAG: hypothetical protein DMG27_11535 [Acidobacteria bacterium]|nr:MAG: hypothetical protein DMG27_11535 [Acidobacteriota bacterium]
MKVAKSADAIRTALLSYAEVDVLYVEVRHQSGPLRYFAGKLAAREINIASGHATTVKGSRRKRVRFSRSRTWKKRLGFGRRQETE